ncbi:aminodeoxychorismate synthase component I [Aquabacter spiritensis]|uniref:aminodeoxychorismate synthase n=1 Tax=Aquabacter spiritensis TaxID=933073 RepID=A0A4R3LX76_9HYPH|nr:aminodeoxychorismate synthase component I [Aquabacter spiritensis]TCT03295.1 aminodeoxychorismate synthase subunit I [Aquabacter spiritensis]
MHIVPLAVTDPSAAFVPFARDPVSALLQSCAPDGARGRYSYLAVAPFRVIVADSDGVRVDGRPVDGDPFAVLKREIAALPAPDGPCPVPFSTGAVGMFGYELGGHVERLPAPRPDAARVPHLLVGLYDTVIAFDHAQGTACLLSSGAPLHDPAARAARAADRAAQILARLAAAPATAPAADFSVRGRWQPEQSRTAVEAAIARTIGYIQAGDIFQANLTQRLRAPRPAGLDDFGLFLRLRALSPAPFAALLALGPDAAVIGASPERFLRLAADGTVETRPIKGTRPRGADPAGDAALAADLLASVKDRAENLMIVDLMRNDLGRVSALGSVAVPVLNGLETFASVHHLVSVVTSRLAPGLGAVDLLRACFPGGSVTGAPKIRAMEIIHELEPVPRGPYCGAVGWIGLDGAMDTSIVIRTLVRAGETLFAQAGGGIVADSDPAAEYEEAMVKLAPLLRALEGGAA